MKKLFTTLVAIAMLATGCKKDDEAAPSATPSATDNNFYFTAKVDGADFAADTASSNTYVNVPHSGMLTISAALTIVTNGVFLINLYQYKGAGSYTVGVGGSNSYARYTTGGIATNNYSAWKAEEPGSTTTGTVTITKDDGKVVEGTLQFEGYSEETKNKKNITEGKFRLKVQ